MCLHHAYIGSTLCLQCAFIVLALCVHCACIVPTSRLHHAYMMLYSAASWLKWWWMCLFYLFQWDFTGHTCTSYKGISNKHVYFMSSYCRGHKCPIKSKLMLTNNWVSRQADVLCLFFFFFHFNFFIVCYLLHQNNEKKINTTCERKYSSRYFTGGYVFFCIWSIQYLDLSIIKKGR